LLIFKNGKEYIFSCAFFDESAFYTDENPSALDEAALSYTQSDPFTSQANCLYEVAKDQMRSARDTLIGMEHGRPAPSQPSKLIILFTAIS
jgi:hypothetical protein